MHPPLVEGAATTEGQKTREDILRAACRLASTDGLEGLTIGKLAKAVGMSKSGLFAHFGSKEDLQLATIEFAETRVVRRIYTPAREYDHGIPRLLAYMDGWFTSADKSPYPGGCVIYQAAAEFDGKPGPVRDLLADLGRKLLSTIVYEVEQAMARGELENEPSSQQVAFELHAFGHEGNWMKQLLGDDSAFPSARQALLDRLRRQATPAGLQLLGDLEQKLLAGEMTLPAHNTGEQR